MGIVEGLFVAGLLLWWIIKSDLKRMASQKIRDEERAKSDAELEEARRGLREMHANEQAFRARRERHLKLVQTQCADAQDSQGLLTISKVSEILGWGRCYGEDGQAPYEYDKSVCDREHCYATGTVRDENPFPAQFRRGVYLASEVIEWIEKVRSSKRRDEAQWPRPV